MWNPIMFLRRVWRAEPDFAEEIAAHLALEQDRLIADGWSPAAARDEARRRFGNVGHVRERYHDARNISWIEDATRDIRYALRTLAKDKAYVFTAVAALGVGLAANIALFSIFAAVALKPLPVRSPERLVTISQTTPHLRFGPFSVADYFFYRDNSRSFENMSAAQPSHLRLAGIASSATAAPAPAGAGAIAEPVIALFVTSNYFATFGVRPIIGRAFAPEDDNATGSYPALISDNYWERRFGRDPSIVGSTLLVSGIRATIVGVSPRDFAGVRPEVPDLWVTLAALGNPRQRATHETTTCCELAGRLAPGVSLQQAQGELASLAAVRRRDRPAGDQQMTVSVSPAVSFGRIGDLVRPLFVALQVAMLLVLLIACANVAGLLLGRAAARQREIAVRLATGASRSRLVRQLVTEGVIVATIAGVVAAVVTTYGLAAASRFAATFLSNQGGGTLALSITADTTVLVYVAGISIAAGVMFTLVPALEATKPNLVAVLKSGSGGSEGSSRHRVRGWLIAGQIALSVALLITATGLARSANDLVKRDPGFRSTSVLTVWLTNPEELGLPASRAREIETLVRDRLRSLPGVQSLAVASRLPLGGNVSTSAMLPEERAGDAASRGAATQYPYAFVSEDYFSTLAIPLVRGRTFTPQEVRDSANVAVISDSMARALWPRGDAIGMQLALGTAPATGFNPGSTLSGTAQIIGIVHDVHGVAMATADVGDVYLPKTTNGWSSRIVLRVNGDAARVTRDIPQIVHEVEPALPLSVQTMDAVVSSDASLLTARIGAGILTLIGVLGLALAAVGVYGMVSYSVRQQQLEIGIRMALGAQPHQVLAAAIRGSVRWIIRGVLAGAVLGAAAIKVTNAVLQVTSFSTSALDPGVLLVVPTLIGAFAMLAALMSGRKAAVMDPAAVLRAEA